MGRHHKPATSHTGRNVAAISISGAFAAIPLTQGTALASPVSESHPVQAVVAPSIDWAPIIHCESGGRPTATNSQSTASGLLQVLDSTWRRWGGLTYGRRAKDATPAQQIEVANRGYAASGLTPWAASRSCWRGKVNTHGTTSTVTDVSMTTPLPSKHGHGHKKRHGKHAKSTTPDTTVTPAVTPTAPATYTVKAGDSLARIAAEHGETWQTLWNANRQAVANPALIHIGQRIALSSSSVPTPPLSPAAASSAVGGSGTTTGSEQTITARITGFGKIDNTPRGSTTISMPVIHHEAGGVGSFDDPLTAASPGHAGSTEFPKGTKFYVPSIRRYVIIEDSGASKFSQPHLDIWSGITDNAETCEGKITGTDQIIKNPGPNHPVMIGPIATEGDCNIPAAAASGGHHPKSQH